VKVAITERAEREIQEAHDWWAANRSQNQAARWYQHFKQCVLALATSGGLPSFTIAMMSGIGFEESTIKTSSGVSTSCESSHRWRFQAYLTSAMLVLLLAANAAVRLPHLGIPLERDEGEFAYGGQLLLDGELPYQSFYAMKFPGIYVAYALIEVLLGQSREAIHLGLVGVNAATVVGIFLLARRLLDAWAGLIAAAAYAVLTLSPAVTPTAAQSEHFVVLFAVYGTWLLAMAVDSGRLTYAAASGLAMGLAAWMKQHGAAFALFGVVVWLLATATDRWSGRTITLGRRAAGCALYSLAAASPIAATVLVIWRLGAFDEFWFWTMTYSRTYVLLQPLRMGMERLADATIEQFWPTASLWVAAALGLAAFVDPRSRRPLAFVTLFSVFAFAAVCPGLYFRSHYFLLFYPAVALLAAIAWHAAASAARRTAPRAYALAMATVIALAMLIWPAVTGAAFFLRHSSLQISRTLYGINPFPEAIVIADFLAKNTRPDETVAILGSEPEIFFYAARRSATRHIYMYPLMEPHPLATEMHLQAIAEFEQARPKFVVFVNELVSWLPRQGSSLLFPVWFKRERRADYTLVGIADIISTTETRYVWGLRAQLYLHRGSRVEVYVRNDSRRDGIIALP